MGVLGPVCLIRTAPQHRGHEAMSLGLAPTIEACRSHLSPWYAACSLGGASRPMAVQADVIGFDEAGAAEARKWLQLLHAQANRDPPKDLFSLFHKTTTVGFSSSSARTCETLDLSPDAHATSEWAILEANTMSRMFKEFLVSSGSYSQSGEGLLPGCLQQ